MPVVSKDMTVRLVWYERKELWWKRGVAVCNVSRWNNGSFEAVLISDVSGVDGTAAPPHVRAELPDQDVGSAAGARRDADKTWGLRKLGSDSGRYRCATTQRLLSPKMPRSDIQFSYQNSKPNAAKTNTPNTLYQQLLARPVLVEAIGQVSPHYKGNLLLTQLLGRNLKRVCHALDIDQDRSVSTV